MRIPVSAAKGQVTELVRSAEAGDEVVPVRPQPDADARRAVIAAVQAAASDKRTAGATAARSQDFLYGEDGLPK